MSEPVLAGGFVPGRHQIDTYGRGGFRFAGMSHRGSILILPTGICAWAVAAGFPLTDVDFDAVFATPGPIDFLLVGTGLEPAPLPPQLRARCRAGGISLDGMTTSAAARTYNVLVAEDRRVGAALIAVD